MFALSDKVTTAFGKVRVRGTVSGRALVPNQMTRDLVAYVAIDVVAADREALVRSGYKFPVVIAKETDCKPL